MFTENDFKHKGLRDFWQSNCKNKSGINPAHASNLRSILVHLFTAKNLDDVFAGLGKLKGAEQLEGGRYSLQVNGNWRVTFSFDFNTNLVQKIYLEDYHGPAGAKSFD